MIFIYKNLKTILLAFILSLQFSCLKKQNLENQDIGPTVNPEIIQEKMGEGIGTIGYEDINLHEKSIMTRTLTLADSQKTKMFTQTLEVDSIDITSKEGKIIYNLFVDHQNHLNPNSSFGGSYTIETDRITKSELRAAEKNVFFLHNTYLYYSLFACKQENTSCHNFNIEDYNIKLPSEFADVRICPNPANCIIPIRKITFDIVSKGILPENTPDREFITFIVSKKLPFFSKVLNFCSRTLEQNGDRKILVDDCYNIDSFSMGENSVQ